MSKRVLILLGIGFLAIVAGILLLKYELAPAAEKIDTEAESIEYDSDIHSDTIQNNAFDNGTIGRAKKQVKKVADDSETLKVAEDGTEK